MFSRIWSHCLINLVFSVVERCRVRQALQSNEFGHTVCNADGSKDDIWSGDKSTKACSKIGIGLCNAEQDIQVIERSEFEKSFTNLRAIKLINCEAGGHCSNRA